jgi:hypothetical protein
VIEAFDPPDDLQITVTGGISATGPVGGPFTPGAQAYTLRNTGSNAVECLVRTSADWIGISVAGGSLGAGGDVTVAAWLRSGAYQLPAGRHTNTLSFSNLVTGRVQSRRFILAVGQPDAFTEIFDAGDNDLGHQTLVFTPDGSPNFYRVCRRPADGFPTDPAGGIPVALEDDAFARIMLAEGRRVSFFGGEHDGLFIGSNGYLTFGSGDNAHYEMIGNHFRLPRISVLYADLNPAAGGSVTWKQLDDRVAVTFDGVPEYGSSKTNHFQVELMGDGTIRLTHLGIATHRGLVGLSRGGGAPVDFVESDLDQYGTCLPRLAIRLPAAVTEGDGTLAGQGRIELDSPAEPDVDAWLDSGDTNSVAVPAGVRIRAGQSAAVFDLLVPDNPVSNGSRLVTISAAAVGFTSASSSLTVTDRTPPGTTTNAGVVVPANSSTNLFLGGEGPASAVASLYAIATPPAFGLVTGLNPTTGEFTYTPAHGFVGTDQLSYTTSVDGSTSAPLTVAIQVTPLPDTDGDGIPDSWEAARGIDSLRADSDRDEDGDELTNLQEYLANTDPLDPHSGPFLPSVERGEGGEFVVRWRAIGGTRYRIQYSDGDTQGNYDGIFRDFVRPIAEEMGALPKGAARDAAFVDDFRQSGGSPPANARYYRVKVVQQ